MIKSGDPDRKGMSALLTRLDEIKRLEVKDVLQ